MACKDTIALRQLGPEDAALYRTLRMEGLQRHPEFFRVAFADENQMSLNDVAKNLERSYTVLATFEGNAAGIGSLAPFAGEKLKHKALLFGMYVRSESGGHGVGETIVRGLIAYAGPCFDSIQLTVAATNRRAQSLYERCGFVHYATEPRSLRVGHDYVDENLLRYDLSRHE